MNKPLGYYTPHTPGDGGLLDQLEQKYGSNFEKLSQRQKFYIINHLAISLSITSPKEDDIEARLIANQMHALHPTTQLGIIKFLVDNSSVINNEFATSQSDPNWDYFDAWGTLHEAKRRIDEVLALMADKEQADAPTNTKAKEMLTAIVNDFDNAILLYFN